MLRIQGLVTCRQCRKEIKTDVIKCIPCDKIFHPGCHKLHKVYNADNEIVQYEGKSERLLVKGNENVAGETSSRDSKNSETESPGINSKIDYIYKTVIQMKDEIFGKQIIKKTITEVIEGELDRIRTELQHWKTTELELVINEAVKTEINKAICKLNVENITSEKKCKK